MPHVHAPGLVLNLDPDELLGNGAQFTCPEDESASTPQFYVCLEADAKQGLWVPQEVATRDLPQRFAYVRSPAAVQQPRA